MTKTKKKKYEKTLIIPVELETWKSMKAISFEKEISMSQLVRWALEKIMHKYKKNVDNE